MVSVKDEKTQNLSYGDQNLGAETTPFMSIGRGIAYPPLVVTDF